MQIFTRSIAATLLPQGPYVLLVDDEEASYAPLGELVRHSGFACVAAKSATDALACYWRRRPAVVVTDLDMPGPDGRALALRVRRRDSSIPIVLVSGQNLDDPAWLLPIGLFSAIFAKPLDLDRFLDTLAKLMKRRAGTVRGGAGLDRGPRPR